MSRECQITRLRTGEKLLEVLRCEHASATGTIVLLHEALGSVSYWKDFPGKLAFTSNCNVVAYSRAGHGDSEGPLEPRSVGYYRNQVEVVLPELLRHFQIESPILYGHSEGAAIALLFAAQQPHLVRALITEAPIVTSEASSQNRIRELAATYSSSDLRRKLPATTVIRTPSSTPGLQVSRLRSCFSSLFTNTWQKSFALCSYCKDRRMNSEARSSYAHSRNMFRRLRPGLLLARDIFPTASRLNLY